MTRKFFRIQKRQQGIALLMSVFVLMLVGIIGISAIQNSENEATAGGRTRRSVRALYAAEAGIQLATIRLSQIPPDLSPIDETLGTGRIVQSRTRSDTGAQPLAYSGSGPPPEGYELASGGGSGFSTDLYQINITASADSSSTAEIEAKLGLLGVGGGGY